jgi:AcrR family transcriptional regulator
MVSHFRVRMPAKVSREKREEYLQDRRQHILNAAIEVFARKGFEGANVADIAQAAEIGKGTVYLYFKSKEEIFRAILQEHSFMPDLLDILQDIDAPIETTLTKMAQRYFDFMRENSAVVRIILLEGGRFMNEPSQVYTESALRGNQAVAHYLQTQIEAGRVNNTVNPFLTARAIMGLLMTHVLLQETLGGKHLTAVDEDIWIREIIRLVLEGILA